MCFVELLDCALKGVCVVIRSNTVYEPSYGIYDCITTVYTPAKWLTCTPPVLFKNHLICSSVLIDLCKQACGNGCHYAEMCYITICLKPENCGNDFEVTASHGF